MVKWTCIVLGLGMTLAVSCGTSTGERTVSDSDKAEQGASESTAQEKLISNIEVTESGKDVVVEVDGKNMPEDFANWSSEEQQEFLREATEKEADGSTMSLWWGWWNVPASAYYGGAYTYGYGAAVYRAPVCSSTYTCGPLGIICRYRRTCG